MMIEFNNKSCGRMHENAVQFEWWREQHLFS